MARGDRQAASDTEDASYAPGNWYCTHAGSVTGSSGVLAAANIWMLPFRIRQLVAIQALGASITTLAAGGNIQLGIYAASLNTLRPTGPVLARTASISTAATGAVSASLSAPVLLSRGIYWWGVIPDATAGAAINMQTLAPASAEAANLVGATALASVMGAAAVAIFCRYYTGATFGTWPDLTPAGSTIEVVTTTHAIGAFQVAP